MSQLFIEPSLCSHFVAHSQEVDSCLGDATNKLWKFATFVVEATIDLVECEIMIMIVI